MQIKYDEKDREMAHEIPDDHPRAQSLRYRHKIIEGMKKKIVAEAGLIAHGRGETFDYLIEEKTNDNAKKTMEVAVAALLSAEYPILSVNGNITALCPDELVTLSKEVNAPLEINLFYGSDERVKAITEELRAHGAEKIYGTLDREKTTIKELSSNRRFVDPEGIKKADVVFVPLEDGDRTEALIRENKLVITIDLNPLSRTAQKANITIVDNVIRAFPYMIKVAQKYKEEIKKGTLSIDDLKQMVKNFNNQENLANSLKVIKNTIEKFSKYKK
ncbi:MAG: phosphopantothenate/pantothenate synthetase [Promethearchaeota archaeon]